MFVVKEKNAKDSGSTRPTYKLGLVRVGPHLKWNDSCSHYWYDVYLWHFKSWFLIHWSLILKCKLKTLLNILSAFKISGPAEMYII